MKYKRQYVNSPVYWRRWKKNQVFKLVYAWNLQSFHFNTAQFQIFVIFIKYENVIYNKGYFFY